MKKEICIKNMRNPILPLEYHVPDSEAHVMPNGRLYIYGSFDNRNDVFCSDYYHVISTIDMKEWTIHDVSLRGEDIPWFNNPNAPKYSGIDWTKPTPFIRKMLEKSDLSAEKEKFEKADEEIKPALLFAPDCIFKNNQYYLYFCMPDDSEGVAVSDKPEGPFHSPVQLPCGGIDPAIFIDDDGTAYYYWGQLYSHGVRMNEDMMSFDESAIIEDLVTEEEHYFHEGSSMRKIGDTYYYVYANMERGKPTSLGYATSKSPLGPFLYQGIIIDNDGCDPYSWNNHGSIECVNGQWYVFYHRCSRGTQQYRRLCIEKISILPDGSIPEVKMTSQGVGDPFTAKEKIYGYQACKLSGTAYIDQDGKNSEWITNISDGDSAIFRYIRSINGFNEIEFETEGTGRILLYLNGVESGSVFIENEKHKKIPVLNKNYGEKIEITLQFDMSVKFKLISFVLYE